MLVERLLNLALIGGEPILWLLLVLSVLCVAVIVERMIMYLRNRIDLSEFSVSLVNLLNEGKVDEAIKMAEEGHSVEAVVVMEGLRNYDKGPAVAKELMDAVALQRRQNLDSWLVFLGTIGSNAPYIGLLGTVLGIIKAFHDLAFNAAEGASAVMAGISEALVATAVGLLVAIPAVVFFNYFKNRQKLIMGNVDQLMGVVLAFIEEVKDKKSFEDDCNKTLKVNGSK